MRKWRNCTSLHSLRSSQSAIFQKFPRASSWSPGRLGQSHLMRAQLRFYPKVTRHEPFDERLARFCMPGHPSTPENLRNRPREFLWVLPATWPIALRDGITEWAKFLFQGGGRPELRGRRGTFCWCRRLVYAVYGVVELFLDRVSAQWTSRSMCSLPDPSGVEGRWQWSSLVAVLGTALDR